MAKLYYRYSAMNSGKTTALIQAAYNYEERGMKVLILKPAVDSKGDRAIISRLGTTRAVDALLTPSDSVRETIAMHRMNKNIHCVLIDEAQFLTPRQVEELFWFAVDTNVPVLAYGLRTDFVTKGFPGASRMLELAHELQELKTICRCGRKALLNGRKRDGQFIFTGEQVAIEGEAHIEYESLCGKCYLQFQQSAALQKSQHSA